MNPRKVLLLVACLALAACGDEPGSLAFSDSGCKGPQADGVLSYLYAPLDAADYDGLQCVSYGATAGGDFAVDLFNFDAACGPVWDGVAAVDGAAVTVGVTNPGCVVADCGSCIYDWAFVIEGVSTGADVELTISVETCPGEELPVTETASLPAGTLGQGLKCRYASWGTLEWLGFVGTLHTPCGALATAEDVIACEGDLVCAAAGEGGREICVAPCGTVADCPLPDIMLCQVNLCVLDPAVGW
ncbi:MAG: hypothetical protein M0R80_26920 [Proteobacteria bacterium]|jgi:hypothetical protein|nr:hypothetical protein [Pseudomonadota bacterium]